MKEIVETIVKALVDNPSKVFVTEVCGASISILELKVDKADLGKVIGKQGRNAGALRIILNAVSVKENRRMVLEILE